MEGNEKVSLKNIRKVGGLIACGTRFVSVRFTSFKYRPGLTKTCPWTFFLRNTSTIWRVCHPCCLQRPKHFRVVLNIVQHGVSELSPDPNPHAFQANKPFALLFYCFAATKEGILPRIKAILFLQRGHYENSMYFSPPFHNETFSAFIRQNQVFLFFLTM